jgi:crotonobetainyl-CoA:carnitine CoA-transferase CaiB-like acyl-CoA transferase
MSRLPLEGIKVVEFVHMVMGPTCGLVLADLGADVVKVEPAPDGDNTRRLAGSGTGFFAALNRNKRSLAVDLKSPDGFGLVRRLLGEADVLVENFRPGAMDRLGLGWEQVSALTRAWSTAPARASCPAPTSIAPHSTRPCR